MEIIKETIKGRTNFYKVEKGTAIPLKHFLTIKSNLVPRLMIYGYELTDKEKEQFDYLDTSDLETTNFFRYKGDLYDVSQFLRASENELFEGWDGYQSHSYFDGLLIKLIDDHVIVGHYLS